MTSSKYQKAKLYFHKVRFSLLLQESAYCGPRINTCLLFISRLNTCKLSTV